MAIKSFQAFSLFNEIHLNSVAIHFGIKKKFEWEDFLRLREEQLTGIIKEPKEKMVDIYPYGSIVFINLLHHEIVDVVNYLMTIDKTLSNPNYDFSDDYILESIDNGDTESIDNDSMKVCSTLPYHMEILSFVLAKSIALEKVEYNIEILLDELELVIQRLETGKLNARDAILAKTSARILRFKYDTISYIMLLDKPDITWNNADAEDLYQTFSHLFELSERYDRLQAKTSTLMDIQQVFMNITQHRKSNSLEWMIIILILIEIIISLIEFFLFKLV